MTDQTEAVRSGSESALKWMCETFDSLDVKFVTLKRDGDRWLMRRFTREPDMTPTPPPVSQGERPYCEMCAAKVHEVVCPTCAKWWADNPPPADLPTPGHLLNELIAELGDAEPFVVSKDEDGWAARTLSGWRALSPSVDQVEAVASAIHDARWVDGRDGPFWLPFGQEDESGQEYCRRLARAAIEVLPALSGDGVREAALEVLSHRVGGLPAQGWLRDNDASRAALAKLAAVAAKGGSERKQIVVWLLKLAENAEHQRPAMMDASVLRNLALRIEQGEYAANPLPDPPATRGQTP